MGWEGGLDGSQRRQFVRGRCKGNLGAAGSGDVAAHGSLFCPPPSPTHTAVLSLLLVLLAAARGHDVDI